MLSKSRLMPVFVIGVMVVSFLAACGAGGTVDPNVSLDGTPGVVSYAKDIQPILDENCIKCHGVEKVSRRLDLTSYDKLMAGSHNGAMTLPNDAEQSPLVQSMLIGKMPKRGHRLTSAQIQSIVDWVKAGAPNN